MFLLVLAVLELPKTNPATPVFWLITATTVLSAGAAWIRTRHPREPFIDPGYFRSGPFSLSSLCGLLASGSQGVLVYTLSISLQAGGDNAITAGLHLVPIALGTVLFSALGGRVLARFGPVAPLTLGGLGIASCGATLLLTRDTSTTSHTVAAFCFGAGFGLANAPITTTAVAGMGANAGAAGGIVSTSRQLGMSVGVAYAGAAAPQLAITQPSWIAILASGTAITACAAALSYATRSAH